MTDSYSYAPEEVDPRLPPVPRRLTDMERQITGSPPGTMAPPTHVQSAADPWAGIPKAAPDVDPWAGIPKAAPEPTKGILTRIKEAVVGQNEFDHPEIMADTFMKREHPEISEPVLNTILTKFPGDPHKSTMDFLQNLNGARGENGMVDVLKQYDPGLAVTEDKFGNKVVNFGGSNYYLNKGGASGRDVQEGFRDTLVTMPFAGAAGKMFAGAHGVVRAAGQFIAGGLGSAVSDKISEEAGAEHGFQPLHAVFSALGGVAGEALGTGAVSLMTRIRNAPSRYVDMSNPAAPTLTDRGAELFRAAGINPDDVTNALANNFAGRIKSTGPTPATAADAAAEEFGINLSRGDATGDFKRQAFEQAAQANARGEWAGNIARKQRQETVDSIDQAKGAIGEDLAPRATGQSPQDNANAVLEGVRAREEASGKVVSSAYGQYNEQVAGKVVPKKELGTLGGKVDAELEKAGVYLDADDQLYPAAARAAGLMKKLEEGDLGKYASRKYTVKEYSYQKGAGEDIGVPEQVGKTVTVPEHERTKKLGAIVLDSLETIRKNIGGAGGLRADAKTPGDRRAVRAVLRAYDDWLDDVSLRVLASEGGEKVYPQIKNARAAAAKHFDLYTERNSLSAMKDDAGKTIEKMVDGDLSMQEVSNWLWGAGKVGESGPAYRVVKRIEEIAGRDSPEWDALRKGMWQKLTQHTEGKTQPGAQAVSQNIFEFVNGSGQSMAKVLFTDEERAMMRRFAAVVKKTVPDPRSANRGQSGYEVARMVNDFFSAAPLGAKGMAGIAQAKAAIDLKRTGAPLVRSPAPPLLPAATAAGAAPIAIEQGYLE